MKLKQVITKEAVPQPGSMQADTSTLRPSADTEVYFEAGIVYAVSPKGCTMVPIGNVRHMIPLDVPKVKK